MTTFLVEKRFNLLQKTTKLHQPNLFYNDLITQLDSNDPLILLSNNLDWKSLESNLSKYYHQGNGRPGKPIRLMAGLLMLKSLENLSDERVVLQWKRNPYYQAFCGMTQYSAKQPCDATELVKFRNRIGKDGIEKIFALSVSIHGQLAQEKQTIIDTTVQENNVTYPTDGKLAIKIINQLHKIAKKEDINLRRSYVKEIKGHRISLRFYKHPKKIKKAKAAMKRLRTIAKTLLRDIDRKFDKKTILLKDIDKEFENNMTLHTKYAQTFYMFMRILLQEKNTKNKIYSLHETHIHAINKGKDHKKYEYGTKASIVTTKTSGIIVGAVAHKKNEHDSKTVQSAIEHATSNRTEPITEAICDRGYRGIKTVTVNFTIAKILQDATYSINKTKTIFNVHTMLYHYKLYQLLQTAKINDTTTISIPTTQLKRDTKQKIQNKREKFKRRAAIEPIIGHLKSDYRLSRNYLRGFKGDQINLLMAATAWNLKKWINFYFFAVFYDDYLLQMVVFRLIQLIIGLYFVILV